MAGKTLRLEVAVGDRIEELVTCVDYLDEEKIAVLVPMVRLQRRPLASGTSVRAEYLHHDKRCLFATQAIGHSPDGGLDYLRLPEAISEVERRRYFRLPTALRTAAIFRVVPGHHHSIEAEVDPEGDERASFTVVDLSEGGVCLSSRARVEAGERMGLRVYLPGTGDISARIKVVAVHEPTGGRLNRRLRCEFIEISAGDRERIARYVLQRQLALRRKGQL